MASILAGTRKASVLLLLAAALLGEGWPATAFQANPKQNPLVCRAIEGLDPLLVPGAVLLLGEVHGTVESPAFAANAVCVALRAGHSATLALEIPREEQTRIEAFLMSDGTKADRAAVLRSEFWSSNYQDGRRSQAMLFLLDEVRQLRRGGRPIRIKLIDRAERPATSAHRDRWMAEALVQALDESPVAVVIALAGNIHTRVSRGTPWDANYEPAGFVLASRKPEIRLTSLNVSHQGGTAWICTSADAASCQARPLRGSPDSQAGRVVLLPQITNGHRGIYGVGTLTASPPAQSPASAQ